MSPTVLIFLSLHRRAVSHALLYFYAIATFTHKLSFPCHASRIHHPDTVMSTFPSIHQRFDPRVRILSQGRAATLHPNTPNDYTQIPPIDTNLVVMSLPSYWGCHSHLTGVGQAVSLPGQTSGSDTPSGSWQSYPLDPQGVAASTVIQVQLQQLRTWAASKGGWGDE